VKSERATSDTQAAGVAVERVFAQSCRVLVEIMHNHVGIETAELQRKMDESLATEKSCVGFPSEAKIAGDRLEFWRIVRSGNRLRETGSLCARAGIHPIVFIFSG
jgi:hypothetical protein